ncbi:hypothetical protein DPMN_147486 [Dreissena polymorpha]|uniref:Uncharacterized protein n=1 Tax=Dreissena polymorpha TaxID=45954 RepID=A0A9D4I742_DREPO|nr:hypothetical protein DPMN_043144 [Dreissena polymorpha]KAH3749678.1 hypothetical protein DPMN_184184 [Dreissena polymorpha]KAH3784525.1 hypothetical protein DPMN_162482 [Dreissena polymorpha]KAH3793958.1 hypothetical protein DPMN_147486 [Dreissena polymorpha]
MSGPLSASKKSMAIPAGIASIRLVASPIGGFSYKVVVRFFQSPFGMGIRQLAPKKSHPKTIRP